MLDGMTAEAMTLVRLYLSHCFRWDADSVIFFQVDVLSR